MWQVPIDDIFFTRFEGFYRDIGVIIFHRQFPDSDDVKSVVMVKFTDHDMFAAPKMISVPPLIL